MERTDRTVYMAALLNGEADNFVGPPITPEPVEQALTVPHLDPAAPGDAQLEVACRGSRPAPTRSGSG